MVESSGADARSAHTMQSVSEGPAAPADRRAGPADDARANTDVASGTSTTAGSGNPLRRIPLARRWRVWWIVGAVLVMATYALVAVAYTADSRQVDASYDPPGTADVTVTLQPRAVDAGTPTLTVQIQVDVGPALLDETGGLRSELQVEVLPAGGQALVFAAGREPDSRTVTVPMTGDIENWPFDDYDTTVVVAAQSSATTAGAAPTDRTVALAVGGTVQGWSASAGAVSVAEGSDQVRSMLADSRLTAVGLHFHRALAIQLFAGVLICILVLMPVLLLAVAIPLYREQRLFEAGFLGYAAAMLFATVPLRNFFPGSPPAGSWVDVLVVLWVLVALVIGIGVTVLAFLRHPRSR